MYHLILDAPIIHTKEECLLEIHDRKSVDLYQAHGGLLRVDRERGDTTSCFLDTP